MTMTSQNGPDASADQAGATNGVNDAWPAPGDYQLKQRRSWKTWQLALVALVFLLVGLAWNYKTVGTSSTASTAPAYHLPPQGASGSTTTTSPSFVGSSSTTTTAASGSTTTTTVAAGGATSTTAPPSAAAGPARVLMGPTQNTGNWTSPAFTTTAAGWNIGWAFRCTPAPASGPSFAVFVTPVGGTPSGTPAVSETGPSGQSVTTQSTTGAQTLVVQAPAGCEWVVKVTGS